MFALGIVNIYDTAWMTMFEEFSASIKEEGSERTAKLFFQRPTELFQKAQVPRIESADPKDLKQ